MESQDESIWDSEPDCHGRFCMMKSQCQIVVDSQEESAGDYHQRDFYESQEDESQVESQREFFSESQDESHDCQEEENREDCREYQYYHHSQDVQVPAARSIYAQESADDDDIYNTENELPHDIYSDTSIYYNNEKCNKSSDKTKSDYDNMPAKIECNAESKKIIRNDNFDDSNNLSRISKRDDNSVINESFSYKGNGSKYNAVVKNKNKDYNNDEDRTAKSNTNNIYYSRNNCNDNDKNNSDINDNGCNSQSYDNNGDDDHVKYVKQKGKEKRVRIYDDSESNNEKYDKNDNNCNDKKIVRNDFNDDSEVTNKSDVAINNNPNSDYNRNDSNDNDGELELQHNCLPAIPLFIIPHLGPDQRIEDWEPLFRAAVTRLLFCDGGESLAIKLLPAYINRRPAEIEVSKDVLRLRTLDDAFELMRTLDDPIDKHDAMQNLCRADWEPGISFDDFYYILRKQAARAGADNDLLVSILINQLPCHVQVIAKEIFMTLKGSDQVLTNENTRKFVLKMKQVLTKRGIKLDLGKTEMTESELSSDFSSLNMSSESVAPQQHTPVASPQHKRYVKVQRRNRANQVCCFVCKKPGHKEIDCTSQYCQRCGVYGHGRMSCSQQTPIKSCLSVKFCDTPIILDTGGGGSSRNSSRLKSNVDHKRAISIVNRSSVSLSTLTDQHFAKYLSK